MAEQERKTVTLAAGDDIIHKGYKKKRTERMTAARLIRRLIQRASGLLATEKSLG